MDERQEAQGEDAAEELREILSTRWAQIWASRQLLMGVARGRGCSGEDAKDVVQEAMLRAAEHPEIGEDRLRAWLCAVTERLCLDGHRRRAAAARRWERTSVQAVVQLRGTTWRRRVCERSAAAWMAQVPRGGAVRAACYALARRVCADDELAEDVVHEVFLTLWRDSWRPNAAGRCFTTWLLTLVHRKAVEAVRRTGPARQLSATDPDRDAPTSESGADRAVTARIAAGQVREALDQLPDEQAQVLMEAYLGGHTLPEIAALTGVPLDIVKSRLYAGVRRLRALLTEQLGPDALIAETRTGWELSR